ncbi:hemerythrin domain-containing protein [Methylobacter sp. Wu1]|uniref:hemerythrin domain-containing protein n=1 Tax=Methylobacter sp. Wu1 TaxID=3119359 RepID=UPI002F94C766
MMQYTSRRQFIQKAGTLACGAAVFAQPALAFAREDAAKQKKQDTVEEVSPVEDLMREHGVLDRILLIYDEILWRRLPKNADFPPEVLSKGADLVRRFLEDYHGKLEEDYVFPRFEKAGKLTDLVQVLRTQHRAGRQLTDVIKGTTLQTVKTPAERDKLSTALRLFVRMYRPHAAREDTVLFPAFRSLVSAHEYAALGEAFENKEHALFGKEGFEKIVAEVGDLERMLGLNDLASFTPKLD